MSEAKSWLSIKINKIARLTKKREKPQINRIRNERGENKHQGSIRTYY